MDGVAILVTGSSGRLGEALARRFPDCVSFDPRPGPYTTHTDVAGAVAALEGIGIPRDLVVFHAGSLHKPNLKTHSTEDFVTLNLLSTATLIRLCTSSRCLRLRRFIYTSTTSIFGGSYDAETTVWIDEKSTPRIKNVYGWSKLAAEQLFALQPQPHLFMVLRACRFFPEEDDRDTLHDDLGEENLKFVHLLNGRRLLLSDVVQAHVAAAKCILSSDLGTVVLNLGNDVAIERGAVSGTVTDTVLLQCYPFLSELLTKKSWKLP